jgi:uncharacterized membrane protein YgdD (TMEM256/DUF423 family)
MDRIWQAAIVLAGLFGAAGVMAAAGASHAGESRNLAAIAAIGLAHGPTMLAIGLAGRGRAFAAAAILLGLGTALFLGDLGYREWQGSAVFPGAAPLGGGAMILGWAAIVVAGLLHFSRSAHNG